MASGYLCFSKKNGMKTGEKRYPDNIRLAMDILRGRWMLSDAEALLPHALDFLAHAPSQMQAVDYTPMMYADDGSVASAAEERKQDKVAVIPLHGPLTKYWSCGTVSTAEIAADMMEYSGMDEIVGFVLDIDSPGGAGNAIYPLTGAIAKIRGMGKPVIVHCDLCASAAYWIASQCDAIFMDNPMSQVGSIGAYATYLDDRVNKQTGEKYISVYARESPDKNRAYREVLEGRYEVCQDELSETVAMFRAAVQDGRPSVKADADGVFTGALFYPSPAMSVGLADGVKTLSECIENVFIRAEFNN